MRIVGYVREAPGRGQSDTAFAQSERIRRWALDTGNEIVAVCQDHHASAAPLDRPGFRALLELVRTGSADAVVVARLDSLSPDKMLQEIMLVDIRRGGATVISTDDADLETLRNGNDDHTRLVVRAVVAKVAEYQEALGLSGHADHLVAPSVAEPEIDERRNVVVELIAPTG
ncbi:MAG TPA: recombinase family protein [Acidimicrobiia bacterium]|nr:recombinase family protein [Acidimicrobiia bacterium]